MKIMVVVGTRPEIIRLSEVIKKLEEFHEVVLVHTGQNFDYNLNDVFFEDLELKRPDHYLDAPGQDLGETVGNIIAKTYKVMESEEPDALLILGDTNSCLSAYSAKRLKIPIFHMEAGNRCFDFNVPEEINRRVVDHVSDINLAYSENARRYLISEGKRTDDVFVTGSPMTEILKKNEQKINDSKVLEKYSLSEGEYFVVSLHREENLDIGDNFKTVCASLNAVAEKYKKPIIFSTHPRTLKRIKDESVVFNPLIKNSEPLGFFDYVKLQQKSYCVLSDSGTISEEASILHFPAVSVRSSQERPEALDAGTIILSGIHESGLFSAIEIATQTNYDTTEILVPDYKDINVSDKVLRIINSYTSIVNARTWRKQI